MYDAVGNLARITYPDETVVNYTYDENNNMISATYIDEPWFNIPGAIIDYTEFETNYEYDENNNLISIEKPDGSVTTNT